MGASRSRSRKVIAYYSVDNGVQNSTGSHVYESFDESVLGNIGIPKKFKKSGNSDVKPTPRKDKPSSQTFSNASHWKFIPFTGIAHVGSSGTQVKSINLCAPDGDNFISIAKTAINAAKFPVEGFNPDKLVSTNKFGLIQFFGELDDTVALFSKKLFKTATSYGGITWGIMPFVSDMKNLMEAFANRAKALHGQVYSDQISYTKVVQVQVGGTHTCECTVQLDRRLSGTLSPPFQASEFNRLAEMLDRIGFHADAASVWDLIPFSFVVDYFLPVGRMLENISGKSWLKHVHFHGWSCDTYTVAVQGMSGYAGAYPYNASVSGYERRYISVDLDVTDAPIVLEPPSVLGIFNTAYLGTQAVVASSRPTSKKLKLAKKIIRRL